MNETNDLGSEVGSEVGAEVGSEVGFESLAEQAFVIFQARKGLAQASHSETACDKPLRYAELVHYVLGNDNIDAARVARGLQSDLTARRVYRQLLLQNRCAHAPRAAYAGDHQAITQRLGQGFTLTFSPAKNRPNQVYVIVKVLQANLFDNARPLILHASEADEASDESGEGSGGLAKGSGGLNKVMRLAFPAPIENKTQLILATDDQRLLCLRNMDSELSLI